MATYKKKYKKQFIRKRLRLVVLRVCCSKCLYLLFCSNRFVTVS